MVVKITIKMRKESCNGSKDNNNNEEGKLFSII
jgi:hypothetical protein